MVLSMEKRSGKIGRLHPLLGWLRMSTIVVQLLQSWLTF
jgi:hypothetical protein